MRRQFNIRLPQVTLDQITTLVGSTGMTQTQVVIVAIDRLLAKNNRTQQAGKRVERSREGQA